MVLPKSDDAREQIGAAQEGAVSRRDAAQHDVVATAGSRVPTVEHELFGREFCKVRLLVKARRNFDRLRPTRRWVHVDLDYTWVRCNFDDV